jgi:hypothetical protein
MYVRPSLSKRELLFIVSIAFFASYMDNAFGVRLNPWYLREGDAYFGGVLNFTGFAPDQYRILPYLLMKPLVSFIPMEFTFLIFKTLFFTLFFLECFRLLDRVSHARVYQFIILFSFIYTIAMHAGFRPVTIFLVYLVAVMIRMLRSDWTSAKKKALLYLMIVLISFTRADVGLFCALFLSFATFRISLLTPFVLVTPVAIQLLLQKVIFPNAVYQVDVITIWQNVAFRFPKSSLLFFIPPILIMYWKTIKGMAVFVHKRYPYFSLVFVLYFIGLMFVARITEFRIYLFLAPFVLYFYNEWLAEKETSEEKVQVNHGRRTTLQEG